MPHTLWSKKLVLGSCKWSLCQLRCASFAVPASLCQLRCASFSCACSRCSSFFDGNFGNGDSEGRVRQPEVLSFSFVKARKCLLRHCWECVQCPNALNHKQNVIQCPEPSIDPSHSPRNSNKKPHYTHVCGAHMVWSVLGTIVTPHIYLLYFNMSPMSNMLAASCWLGLAPCDIAIKLAILATLACNYAPPEHVGITTIIVIY